MKVKNSTKLEKKLGIWMDHSIAYLMEYSTSTILTRIINLDFSHEDKQQSLTKSESLMHNKEQHLQLEFYNKIADVIDIYDNIIIFGPTTAKDELNNLLKDDVRFSKKKIEIENAHKMTETQQHSFVKLYFNSI